MTAAEVQPAGQAEALQHRSAFVGDRPGIPTEAVGRCHRLRSDLAEDLRAEPKPGAADNLRGVSEPGVIPDCDDRPGLVGRASTSPARADCAAVARPRTLRPMALPQQRTNSSSAATAMAIAVSLGSPLRQLGRDTSGLPPGDRWGKPPSEVGD
ncbi:hypothetical protein ABZS81_13605 [Streptomyces sp. NPDC005318]|uniref:hypothetical protein n=1 Tax=Streptomyces sp. NPDC005318 TaxID=3157031 RepID=UPI0033B7E7D8